MISYKHLGAHSLVEQIQANKYGRLRSLEEYTKRHEGITRGRYHKLLLVPN